MNTAHFATHVLERLGGLAHRRTLVAAGVTGFALTKAVGSGAMFRVRQAWYALEGAHSKDVIHAVRVGGRLTSFSLLAHLGVWTPKHGTLHVAVMPNGGRLRSPEHRQIPLRHSRREVDVHWSTTTTKTSLTDFLEPLDNAVAHLLEWPDIEDIVVAIDSLLNKRLMLYRDVLRILERSTRGRRVAALLDPQSQSGLESMVRCRLRRRGIRVDSQVTFEGIGTVDLVAGERLIIEVDGFAYHSGKSSFESDRRRDVMGQRLGMRVLRFSRDQITEDWPTCEDAILRLVRAREHRRRPSAARHFLPPSRSPSRFSLQNSG